MERTSPEHVLRPGFAENGRVGQRSLSREQDRETGRG